ncbi:MAG TPA: MauE/DoxX family redox-associated membrane protein [Streptosporangiaceae bacterium]|nr:MauE/DoxX family redox-associated membrane protein [Streptosporangiaceae bacterium]
MFGAIREVQIPLLTVMLLGGCGAKALKVLKTRNMAVGLGPTALFPLRLRRPIAMAMCATECGLGIALIITAGSFGAGMPATVVRTGVSVLFLIAVGALIELRERRPEAGCGCFGDLSVSPVGARTIARSALLAVAAIATIGQPPLQMPESGRAAGLWIALLVAEVLVLAGLSPEVGKALARLGYSEPCEVRRISVDRTLAALASSATWRQYASLIGAAAPVDIWRERCWRFVVYPGETGGLDVNVVFAVHLRSRRPQVRVAVLDAVTDEALTDPPRTRPAPDREISRPTPEPARFRELPELGVTRPVAGLGARASLHDRPAVAARAGLRPPARLDDPSRPGAPARRRSSAPL